MTSPISASQLRALEVLAPELENGTYLAGGVAVAISLEHRQSHDLDLFVPHDFDSERLEESIAARVPGIQAVGRARGTLNIEFGGIPISILSYRYPLLRELERKAGLPIVIASIDDLACMKISAISGRGAAKDFWDLHEILLHGLAGGSLARALDLYTQKFPIEDIGHAIRSLVYFADADASPLPLGLSHEHWKEIKSAFAKRVKEL